MSEQNGEIDRNSQRRALIFSGIALVALLATLKLLGVFGHFQRIEATIVDSADSKALVDATIVALYTRSCVGSDGVNEKTVLLSRETSSDEGGAFVLEEANLFSSPGPKSFALGICQFADEPDVYIFKTGYTVGKFSSATPTTIPLSPQGGEDDLDSLKLSVKALKGILADDLLAKTSPAFYSRLQRYFEQTSLTYQQLHKAHVDDLQDQLKKISRPALEKMSK